MTENKYLLKIDLKRRFSTEIPTFVQYDDARLEFILLDAGVAVDLSGVTKVEFAHKRPDGITIVGDGGIAGDTIYYDYAGTEMEAVGTVMTSFSVFDADGTKVSVQPFSVQIVTDLRDDLVNPADPQYGALQTLIAEVDGAVTNAETATTNATTQASYAQTQGDYAKQVADENKNVLLAPVANFAAITTSYPSPVLGSKVQTTDNGKIYRWNGSTWAYIEEMNNNMLTDIQTTLNESARATTTLATNTSIVSGGVDAIAYVEIEGRTLTSLGNSNLEATKQYVVADKKTKVIVDGVTHSGVAKFTKGVGTPTERPIIIRVENFDWKISGSTVENPHTVKIEQSATVLQAPSVGWDGELSSYSGVQILNGVNVTVVNSVNGGYPQQLFSFNLIEAVERNIGKIPRSSVADKVTWLKANVSKITANWWGFGSSPTGNGAYLDTWRVSDSIWLYKTQGSQNSYKNSTNTVSKITNSTLVVSDKLDVDGKIHFLAYAEPSDGITASSVSTDYIDLEIELKPTADFTRPKVALYEVDATQYGKILVDYDADEVVRRFPIVEGTQHLQGVNVTAEGENLLPPFSEWTLHANAKVLSPYELELNATGAGQSSGYKLPVVPNTIYSFNSSGIGKFSIDEQGATGNYLRGKVSDTQNSTFTTSSDCYFLYFYTRNSTTGVHTFTQPMLTLGSTAKPFVPRNTSSFLADVKLGSIGTSKDVLYESEGNRFVRKVVEKDVVLDGSLAWVLTADYTGFKRLEIPITNALDSSGKVVKYDGKTIPSGSVTTTVDVNYLQSSVSKLFTTISDTDTGFGETYTPSTAEIKAYFYGYQMNNGTFGTPYNGTGTKTWIPLGDTANTRAVTVVPTSASPTQVDGTVKPYMLSYILATPQTVNVTDKVEGQMKVNGSTQVSVESGVVRREKVVPSEGSATYQINHISYPTSFLKNKVLRILKVYKNGVEDSSWAILSNSSNGVQRAEVYKSANTYDSTAEYTVTYVALDKHLLSAHPTSVKLTYANNIRSALEDAVGKVQDNSTQLSVHEKAIVDLYVRVKAIGG